MNAHLGPEAARAELREGRLTCAAKLSCASGCRVSKGSKWGDGTLWPPKPVPTPSSCLTLTCYLSPAESLACLLLSHQHAWHQLPSGLSHQPLPGSLLQKWDKVGRSKVLPFFMMLWVVLFKTFYTVFICIKLIQIQNAVKAAGWGGDGVRQRVSCETGEVGTSQAPMPRSAPPTHPRHSRPMAAVRSLFLSTAVWVGITSILCPFYSCLNRGPDW